MIGDLDANKSNLLLEQWKTASELHRHMDQMAWQSLSYFAALNGGLLSAIAVVWSNDFLSIRGKEVVILGLSVFAGVVSFVWSKIQKRMQMYHWLRLRQASKKEHALLASNKMIMAGDQYMLIYGDELEKYEDVMNGVCCSRWGKTSNHSLVFGLAIGLMIIWILISVIALLALVMPSLADPILITFFSPIQPCP